MVDTKSLNNSAIHHFVVSVTWLWTGSPFKERKLLRDWTKCLDLPTKENHKKRNIVRETGAIKSTKPSTQREISIFYTHFICLTFFSPQFADCSEYNTEYTNSFELGISSLFLYFPYFLFFLFISLLSGGLMQTDPQMKRITGGQDKRQPI